MPETRAEQRKAVALARRRRMTLWVSLGVAGVLLLMAGWIGIRGMIAKDALEESVPLASAVTDHIIDGDREATEQAFAALSSRTSEAAALTSDPIWRAGELVPFVGVNLVAVREAAAIVDDVTRDGIAPIVSLSGELSVEDFKPVDGAIDLHRLLDAQPRVAAASASLTDSARRAKAIDTDTTFGIVTDAVTRLQTSIGKAAATADAVERAVTLLPSMLGVSGERNYLLLFQNPAEPRATGGIPGAVALLHVSKGKLDLVQQASSSDFPKAPAPVLELPADTRSLYGDITGQFIQDVNLTPQFPLSARLAQEMWRQQFGTEVDGVLSVDPVTLSYLLKATGPIDLPSGDTLASDNAVQLLLADVYARYAVPAQQDAFFAAAASSVFDAVAAGNFEPAALLGAVSRAGDEHRVLIWSAHDDEQKRLAETTLAGELPVSDSGTAIFGVYLNDATGSKMGMHLDTVVGVGQANCREDGLPQFGVEITLTNTAPADAATALPAYVTGGGHFGVTPGNIRIMTNVYGPKDSQNLGLTRNGAEIPHHPTTDSGYPVSALTVELAPGETTSLRANFLGGQAFDGQLAIRKTPDAHNNDVRQVEITCELP